MINTQAQAVEQVVTRGVERIFPNEDFLRSRLASGEQLTVYLGIDPTGPTLHLGHVIPLLKLKQLQGLGHRVILLIGDITAQIGDPDKSSAREQLTHEQVLHNAQQYQQQASLFLDFDGSNPAELKYNSQWLKNMTFPEVIHLASNMTVQRMLDRDMFRRRMDAGNPIYIHEFLYPLMQGYDAQVMGVDGEVGGNDQTFNMLVGRDLLKQQDEPKEKFVIPMKLLVDPQGNKMGKTTGNMVALSDAPDIVFKKVMTWPDDALLLAFELLTDIDLVTVQQRLASDENPRDIKHELATSVVTLIHGAEAATTAGEQWVQEVSQQQTPEDIPQIVFVDDLITTLAQASGESRSQIKRLFKEGAVRVNAEPANENLQPQSGDIIKIGKKRWYQIQ